MFTFTLFRDLLKVQLNSRFIYLHADKGLACLNIPTAVLDAYGTLAGPRLTLQFSCISSIICQPYTNILDPLQFLKW